MLSSSKYNTGEQRKERDERGENMKQKNGGVRRSRSKRGLFFGESVEGSVRLAALCHPAVEASKFV